MKGSFQDYYNFLHIFSLSNSQALHQFSSYCSCSVSQLSWDTTLVSWFYLLIHIVHFEKFVFLLYRSLKIIAFTFTSS